MTRLPLREWKRTAVASATSSTPLALKDPTRRMLCFYNASSAALYLGLGPNTTTGDFTVIVPAGGYYELPWIATSAHVSGVWASVNGSAMITEGG